MNRVIKFGVYTKNFNNSVKTDSIIIGNVFESKYLLAKVP